MSKYSRLSLAYPTRYALVGLSLVFVLIGLADSTDTQMITEQNVRTSLEAILLLSTGLAVATWERMRLKFALLLIGSTTIVSSIALSAMLIDGLPLFGLTPQILLGCLILCGGMASMHDRVQMFVLTPAFGVLTLVVAGISILSFVGHAVDTPVAYAWRDNSPFSLFYSLSLFGLSMSSMLLFFEHYKSAKLSSRQLRRLIVNVAVIGVLALSVFSALFTTMPFYALIQDVRPSLDSAPLRKGLIGFGLGAILLSLLGSTGILALLRDLAGKVETHQQDAASGWRIADLLVGQAPDGIIRLDEQGVILGVNPAAQTIFGVVEKDVLGTRIETLLQPHREACAKGLLDLFRYSEQFTPESERLQLLGSKDHMKFPVEASVSAMRHDGRLMYILFLRDVTERQEYETALEDSLQEKELLLKEVHHRVKNNLQIISSLLKLQKLYINDEAAKASLKESQCRVQSMALAHELIYRGGDLANVNFAQYIQELCSQVIRASDPDQRVKLSLNLSEASLSLDQAIPCGLLINELLTNSIQHAFPKDSEGTIFVRFKCDERGMCRLEIRDDGVGIPKNALPQDGSSLGARLIYRLLGQLRAEYIQFGSPGYGIRFSFQSDNSTEEIGFYV